MLRKFRLQAHVRNRPRPELELVPPDYSERATEVSVPYNGTTRAVLIRQNASTTDLTLPGYPVRSRMINDNERRLACIQRVIGVEPTVAGLLRLVHKPGIETLPLGAGCTVEWQSDEKRSFCFSPGYSRVPFG